MYKKCVYLQWTVKYILLIGPLKNFCKAEDFTDRPKHVTTAAFSLAAGFSVLLGLRFGKPQHRLKMGA